MSKLYTTIPAPKVPRNTFDRTRPNTLSMHFQKCVPTMLEEIYPGDLFSVGSETFARLQPLIAPVMNNMKISNHAFFVPLRTLNNHFSEFMFNNRNGDYSEVLPYTTTDVLYDIIRVLYMELGGEDPLLADVVRLYDFIGLPFVYESNVDPADFMDHWLANPFNVALATYRKRINLVPFFGYTKVWSEYFRDENLVDDPFDAWIASGYTDVKNWTGLQTDLSTYVSTAINEGTQQAVDYVVMFADCFLRLRPRAWAHDRFTSSLPFAQRGPDVLLPIAGSAPVVTTAESQYSEVPVVFDTTDGVNYPYKGKLTLDTGSPSTQGDLKQTVDFSDAELTTTINDFRRAERLQRWFENSARGGVRPNEATLAHFGVRTPDATLDRSEFLGGYMQPLVISEIAQTSETTEASPQGTLAGKGTSYKGANLFRHYFTEHGFVFVFTSALVRANYWQGIPKVFSRMQRDEYYWPEFANLGEEPVYVKELYGAVQGESESSDPYGEDVVFGYVPRYSDLKSAQGEVHGDMRSSLSFWTQTREFENTPQLNEEFIYGNPSLSPFAVQSETVDPIVCTIQYTVKASRLMPFYGVPTI